MSLTIGLVRALSASKSSELKHGQFPKDGDEEGIHAVIRHVAAVVGIADQVVARKNQLHHICLDYPYPRAPAAVNVPTALLLTNDAGSISIPIKWTAAAISFASSDRHGNDVVVSTQAPFAGTLISNHIIDVAVDFFSKPASDEAAA